jgi:hypothetical protein
MNRLARIALAACAVLATCGARFVGAAPPTPRPITPPLEPDTVLVRYADALAGVKRPPAVSFDFWIEQLGLHNIEQVHRVYRSGTSERDETLSIDGYPLRTPEVRILLNRRYPYDITAVAPKLDAYVFTLVNTLRSGNHYTYTFATKPRAPRSFTVSQVTIDGETFLPSTVRFSVRGGNARGDGRLRYGKAGRYWVVSDATVAARLADGKPAHERIVWVALPLSDDPADGHVPRVASGGDSACAERGPLS